MKNIVILITLLTTINVVAQDTIKYGDPQYLFNRRVNPLLSRYVNGYNSCCLVDYDSLNDTTGQPYRPISGMYVSSYVVVGYHTDEPIRIYGIALNAFRLQGTTDIRNKVLLFQYSNGILKALRVADNYTRENLFLSEGYYILDNNQQGIYYGSETVLSHCYEFFFDTPASVHDTFFVVEVDPSISTAIPAGYNLRNIPLYDSIGYPETYDDQFAEKYCDFDFIVSVPYTNGETYYRPPYASGSSRSWGMIFPIIMPLDGIDTLGAINPDSLWYYTPDSLGVMAVPTEPEVYLAPNPATGSTTLTTDVPVSRLLMHNVDGRLVRELSPNATRVEINLAGLPKGLYIISAVTPQGTAHRKLIVR